ncbi:carbamoyltransferase [Nonomuraea sp. NPDC049400]|uniref:carbamoyltransferase n=1 Tax=Nonomuraea sp. NPDC049400 TaxID=3364352 RepID=UPI00379D1B57
MRVLGINAIGHHDASVCLIEDGRVVAFAEEERFIRDKHARGRQPVNAVRWCLDSRSLTWADIDALATPWAEEEFGSVAPPGYHEDISFGERELGADWARWPVNIREFAAMAGCRSGVVPLFQVSHHLAHAASAYWCSGFDETAILVVDGEGDRVSTTLAHGDGGRISVLRQFSTVDSLGQFYACLTRFLGLGSFGEGKLMGLAPYGRPVLEFPEIELDPDGYRLRLDPGLTRWDPVGTTYRSVIEAWIRRLSERFGEPREARERGLPTALADWTQQDRDIAASGQFALEEALVHLAELALRLSGSRRLVIAGGVALNCSANGRLAHLPGLEGFFAQPAAGDDGAPIGAALHASVMCGVPPVNERLTSISLGPSFGADTCAKALSDAGLAYREPGDITEAAGEHLSRNEVVCWFEGRMEGGPRALGQRSIVASPASAATRDRVNDIKRRARWRPLAPSLRREDAGALLERGGDTPFMIVADRIAADWRERVPGVVHADGSARPHTVDRAVQPAYWSMIDHFQRRTGLPAVINTSFNDEREPIVCSPEDAVRTFLRSGADVLCLGPYLAHSPSPETGKTDERH